MELSPYSIYANNRPFRIAFLVNPDGDGEWFDIIRDYNREKWGGRFNPIILTNGKTIEDSWWKFLRDYDPDIIFSSVELSEELQKKIQTFLSPLSVEINKLGSKYVYLSNNPISIIPTKRNISLIARDFPDHQSSLVIFEISSETPEIIKKFLDRNFGIVEDNQMTPFHLKRALQDCKKKNYKIKDFESLNQALLDLGEFHTRVVFYNQICSLPNQYKDVEYSYDNEKFVIIVGDTPDELSYLWNHTLTIPNWMRTGLNQLWITKEMIENPSIKTGLEKFVNRYVGQTGNNNQHGANFITFSLEEEAIKKISESFNGAIWHPKKFTKYNKPKIPDFGQYSSFFRLRSGLNLYRAHTQEEHLVLSEPNVEDGIMGGEYWFVDLYIQFRPERFENIIGKDYWWQLPKRNNILSNLSIFNKPARINEQGMFSVLMRRKNDFSLDENTLIIKIPEDRSIFWSLICGGSYDCVDTNKRSGPFYNISPSDKGLYLSGILSLLDLSGAHHLLEQRYWRRMFEKMSNENLEQNDDHIIKVFNNLKKNIKGRNFSAEDEAGLQWLSRKILHLAKPFVKQEIDLTYQDFLTEAKKEHEEFSKKNNNNKFEFRGGELRGAISRFIRLNVLMLGIKPKCPNCGYRIWYHIDEVKQELTCKGCGYNFTIRSQEEWYYRLNSLVRSAFSLHGTVPVLLVLGQLMRDARSSFLFQPSVNLLGNKNDNSSDDLTREIDIACIRDGKFIIGEIKQSIALFDTKEFDKISDIAKLLKPDLIIFSSLDREPNQFVKDNIERIKKVLSYLEIDVIWYPINYWVFEPEGVGWW